MSVTKVTATPAKSSAAQSKSTRSGVASIATPDRRALLGTRTPKRSPASKPVDPKKVLLPTRDPQGNSPIVAPRDAGKHAVTKAKKSSLSSQVLPKLKSGRTSLNSTLPAESTPRASSLKPRGLSITELVESSITTQLEMTTSEALSSVFNPRERARFRTSTSSTSLAPQKSGTTAPSRSRRAVSSTSLLSEVSQQKRTSSTSPAPPVPSLPAGAVAASRYTSSTSKSHQNSRTPSPDLPGIKTDPVASIPTPKKKGMAVLGLGTPEVKAWIKAGQNSKGQGAKGITRAKSVGFKETANRTGKTRQAGDPNDSQSDEDDDYVRERSLSIQISPRKSLPTGSSSQTHAYSQSWNASPLRPRHPGHVSGTPSAGSAHELLRTIVKDVMYDFQKETKAEMMGLHLDLVRMGRGWKQELRTLMEEYVGDLNDLRDENRRLREENERLRRGY